MSFQKYKHITNKNIAHTVQAAFKKGRGWRAERRKGGPGQSLSSKRCAALETNQPPLSLALECWGRQNCSSHSEHTWFWPQKGDSCNQQKTVWLRDSTAEGGSKEAGRHRLTATASSFTCLPFLFCETNGTSGQKGKGAQKILSLFTGGRNPPGTGGFPISS